MIDTTICISQNDIETLAVLTEGCVSKQKYFLIAMLKSLAESDMAVSNNNNRILYNNRRENISWHRMHLYLSEPEYEFLQDLRRFFKVSISFLISIALSRYNKLLPSGLRGRSTDNYRVTNHVMSVKMEKSGIRHLESWWGVPDY